MKSSPLYPFASPHVSSDAEFAAVTVSVFMLFTSFLRMREFLGPGWSPFSPIYKVVMPLMRMEESNGRRGKKVKKEKEKKKKA